jgi:hypothetical protein
MQCHPGLPKPSLMAATDVMCMMVYFEELKWEAQHSENTAK